MTILLSRNDPDVHRDDLPDTHRDVFTQIKKGLSFMTILIKSG
jgi:hypothetical protein